MQGSVCEEYLENNYIDLYNTFQDTALYLKNFYNDTNFNDSCNEYEKELVFLFINNIIKI